MASRLLRLILVAAIATQAWAQASAAGGPPPTAGGPPPPPASLVTAETESIITQENGSPATHRMSLEVGSADTEEDIRRIREHLAADFEKARSANPQVKLEVVADAAETGADATAARETAKILADRGGMKAKSYPFRFQKFNPVSLYEKYHRLTFALIRGLTNGGVTLWLVMVSHQMTLFEALPLAAVVGSISFSILYWLKHFQKVVDADLLNRALKVPETSRWNSPFKYGYQFGGVCLGMELAFVAIMSLTMKAMGLPPLDPSHVAMTGGLGVFAQAPWMIAVAQETKLLNQLRPDFENWNMARAEVTSLLVSVAEVGLSASLQMGWPIAMVGLGIEGVAGLTKLYFIQKRKAGCQSLLSGSAST